MLALFYVMKNSAKVFGKSSSIRPPNIITINVPVVFMALYVMILRGATSLRGALEGVGPENRDFFGPWNGTGEASAIWAQKSRVIGT
jgi:hypothetical protein